jgi:hypothetical protein
MLLSHGRSERQRHFYTFSAFDERRMLDFLTGATVWLQESPANDPSKAAEQAAYQIRHGLSNGFYAELLTHEQKLGVLKREEWGKPWPAPTSSPVTTRRSMPTMTTSAGI